MNGLTLEQLATLAREKSDAGMDAQAALCERLAPMIRRTGRRNQVPGYSQEDLFSEGALVCLESVHTWDPTRPALPYFQVAVRNRLKELFRAQQYQKRGSGLEPLTGLQEWNVMLATDDTPGRETLIGLRQLMQRRLSPQQIDCLLLAADDCTLTEIAREMGLTFWEVRSEIATARALLADFCAEHVGGEPVLGSKPRRGALLGAERTRPSGTTTLTRDGASL